MTALSTKPDTDAKRQAMLQALKNAGRSLTIREVRDLAGLDVLPSALRFHLRALVDVGLVVQESHEEGYPLWRWSGEDNATRPCDYAARQHTGRINYRRFAALHERMRRFVGLLEAKPMTQAELADYSGETAKHTKATIQRLARLGCVRREAVKTPGVSGQKTRYHVTDKPLPPLPSFEEWWNAPKDATPIIRMPDPEEEELSGTCYLPSTDEIKAACEEIRRGWKWSGDSEATIGPPRLYRLAMSTRRKAC